MKTFAHFVAWRLGLIGPQSQTSQAERMCLARHAAGCRALVEIGVWHGLTTASLRRVMAPDGVLWAVDPFRAGRLGFSAQRFIARREVARVGNGFVRWARLSGVEAAQRYRAEQGTPLDFLFIDGDHAFDVVRGDWEAWSPMVRVGGVVALHDSRPTDKRPIHDAGSVQFTQRHVLRDERFSVVEVIETLTVVRRIVAR